MTAREAKESVPVDLALKNSVRMCQDLRIQGRLRAA
jgi:hypothetical protein